MMSRRSLVAACAAVVALAAVSIATAQAFAFRPYDAATVQAAIKSGKPVIVHVYAPWCLQCRAQAANLAGLSGDHQLDGVSFFKVDYDDQKDIVTALNVPRSTLIGYKGGKEVARMSWGTSRDDVVKIIQSVF